MCAIATAAAAIGYLPAWGFWPLLIVSLFHAFALAPTTNLADALALVASRTGQGFEYGWVRGAGSAAFILGSLLAGLAISLYGLPVIIGLQAALMLAVPFATRLVPPVVEPIDGTAQVISRARMVDLLRLPVFRRCVVLIAALILGSHAMHDTFAMRTMDGRRHIALCSERALVDVRSGRGLRVFSWPGPWLLRVLTPAGAIALRPCTWRSRSMAGSGFHR